MTLQQGDFVEARGRRWLVGAIDDAQRDLMTARPSCIDDDAQGEQVEVLWETPIAVPRKSASAPPRG